MQYLKILGVLFTMYLIGPMFVLTCLLGYSAFSTNRTDLLTKLMFVLSYNLFGLYNTLAYTFSILLYNFVINRIYIINLVTKLTKSLNNIVDCVENNKDIKFDKEYEKELAEKYNKYIKLYSTCYKKVVNAYNNFVTKVSNDYKIKRVLYYYSLLENKYPAIMDYGIVLNNKLSIIVIKTKECLMSLPYFGKYVENLVKTINDIDKFYNKTKNEDDYDVIQNNELDKLDKLNEQLEETKKLTKLMTEMDTMMKQSKVPSNDELNNMMKNIGSMQNMKNIQQLQPQQPQQQSELNDLLKNQKQPTKEELDSMMKAIGQMDQMLSVMTNMNNDMFKNKKNK